VLDLFPLIGKVVREIHFANFEASQGQGIANKFLSDDNIYTHLPVYMGFNFVSQEPIYRTHAHTTFSSPL
jgi:hypothetical protein